MRKIQTIPYAKAIQLLKNADKIAETAHKGQFRHDNVTPYVEHPRAVAHQFYNKPFKIISLLHDVVEDSNITFADLLKQGFPFDIVSIIETLTRRKDETYLDYIWRINQNSEAIPIKLADLKHNMSECKNKHQLEKYQLATFILEKL